MRKKPQMKKGDSVMIAEEDCRTLLGRVHPVSLRRPSGMDENKVSRTD
jgi:hypothetical protein